MSNGILSKSSGVWLHQKVQRLSVVGESLIFFLKALWGFIVIHNLFQEYFFNRSAFKFSFNNFYLPYKENNFFVLKNLTQKCHCHKNIDQSTQNFKNKNVLLLFSNGPPKQLFGDSPFLSNMGQSYFAREQCCCVLHASSTVPPNKFIYNQYHAFWQQFSLYGTCGFVYVYVCCCCI